MDETCNMKIQRLEIVTEAHEKRLDQQEVTLQTQGESLLKITQLLSQVRWLITGAVIYYVFNNFGLEAALKTLLGV